MVKIIILLSSSLSCLKLSILALTLPPHSSYFFPLIPINPLSIFSYLLQQLFFLCSKKESMKHLIFYETYVLFFKNFAFSFLITKLISNLPCASIILKTKFFVIQGNELWVSNAFLIDGILNVLFICSCF